VTSANDEFRTRVRDSAAQWPSPPQMWSYSSLREAQECPRRWMLSRATYPGIWSRRGYPPRPTLVALLGDVVHRILEVVLRGFHAQGCTSLQDPRAVAVLKQLGGYSKLAERAIQEQLDRLTDNPRAVERIDGLRAALLAKVPEIRQHVQGITTRTSLKPAASSAGGRSLRHRPPLTKGSHPEVELRAPELRLAGRADLVTVVDGACEITDYKTGTTDEHHTDQLRTYALLWARDTELNPEDLPIRRLTLSYPSRDIDIEPPTATQLEQLASRTVARISEAERWLRERPPPARPSAPMCRLCGVRQLCEDYWQALNHMATSSSDDEPDWFDYEGIVTSKNGSRSWLMTADEGSTLLLRTSSETTTFPLGHRIRLLNLLRGRDPDAPVPIGALTQASEVFLLGPPS
jgi:PD-(D/E)XK nuclease superfamily